MKRTMQILALWAALGSWAGAQTIIQHIGTNNPTSISEGFLQSNGTGMSLFPTNDGGTAAWTIFDTNITDNIAYYKQFTTAQTAELATRGWHVLWNAKAIEAPAPRSWEIGFSLTNDTGNARRYLAAFERSGADMIVDLVTGPTFTVLGMGDGFHTWEFKRSPGTDVAGFWVDGQHLTNYSGFNDVAANIEWGSLPAVKTSHVEWAWILVEVPEPSSLLLFGVATAIGILRRRRK